ncbi:MAG: cation:proton antiporter [Candidatus Ornithospirochaeta sp.]|nr:cation:proton antiporter [Candidatus Ornithospirochaeta sp.]
MDTILVSLAFALIAGLLMSRLAKLVNLPAVTAYLIAGLLIGPFCFGKLGISGLGFNSLAQVSGFDIISNTALGFIAFAIGNEFRLKDLKVMGRAAITVGILQAVITTAIVDIVLIALHFVFPSVISLPAAITLGAIAAATAPAATLMVVRQYKAEGPLTKLLLMVVAIDDAVGLVLFSVSFGIASALETGAISIASVILEPIIEIGASLVLGALAGLALHWLERYFHSRSKRLSLAVAFVFLMVGFAQKRFEIGGIHVGFSLLLVCMITGTVFCNICETSEELMARLERWTAPLNMLFFILSGAELNLQVLSNPLVILVGIIYIASRSCGKIGGAYISCRMEHTTSVIQKHLGITLLPQAGVALGMALTASNLMDGAIVKSVVLFSVLVYELVGPTLTKWSLLQAGEIKPEGRKSSREVNVPEPPKNISITK